MNLPDQLEPELLFEGDVWDTANGPHQENLTRFKDILKEQKAELELPAQLEELELPRLRLG